MKQFTQLIAIAALMFAFVLFTATPKAYAQEKDHGRAFVDENGDGYNDNAPDADGDGIPNGQDPDYTAAGANNAKKAAKGFVDANGDGINDNAADDDGDGVPNGQDPDYVRPQAGKAQTAGKSAMTGRGKKGQRLRGAKNFVDENGDGINDNAPDADGDGIPNGQDKDFVRPDNAGRHGKSAGKAFHGFVDEDGDGFNDNAPDFDSEGIPNGQDSDWVRPEDCFKRGFRMGGDGAAGTSDDADKSNDKKGGWRRFFGRGGKG